MNRLLLYLEQSEDEKSPTLSEDVVFAEYYDTPSGNRITLYVRKVEFSHSPAETPLALIQVCIALAVQELVQKGVHGSWDITLRVHPGDKGTYYDYFHGKPLEELHSTEDKPTFRCWPYKRGHYEAFDSISAKARDKIRNDVRGEAELDFKLKLASDYHIRLSGEFHKTVTNSFPIKAPFGLDESERQKQIKRLLYLLHDAPSCGDWDEVLQVKADALRHLLESPVDPPSDVSSKRSLCLTLWDDLWTKIKDGRETPDTLWRPV